MTRPSVLLITSKEAYREWLAKLLEKDYQLTICHKEELSQLSLRPDLLITSWEQADPAWLREVRRQFNQVPWLAMAQQLPGEQVAQAFRYGVNDFLLHPSEAELLAALRRLLPRTAPPPSLSRWVRRLGQSLKSRAFASAQTAFSTPLMPFGPGAKSQPSAPAAVPHLEAQLLGRVEFRIDGHALPPMKSRKALGVLAYLLARHPRPVPRERLMEEFWADVMPHSARNSLNVAWYQVRKCFQAVRPDEDPIRFDQGCYQLHPEWDLTIDVQAFQEAAQQGRIIEQQHGLDAAVDRYQQAADLYQGDFVENFPYLEWVNAERESLRETYLNLLERLAQYYLDQGQPEAVRLYTKRILSLDPCREQAHQQLMTSLYCLGYRNQAIRQYQRCCTALHQELGIGPSPRTAQLYEQIRQRTLPGPGV